MLLVASHLALPAHNQFELAIFSRHELGMGELRACDKKTSYLQVKHPFLERAGLGTAVGPMTDSRGFLLSLRQADMLVIGDYSVAACVADALYVVENFVRCANPSAGSHVGNPVDCCEIGGATSMTCSQEQAISYSRMPSDCIAVYQDA